MSKDISEVPTSHFNTDIQDAVAHKDRTDNPHNVSASQIGAITKVEDDPSPTLGGDLNMNGHKIAGKTESEIVSVLNMFKNVKDYGAKGDGTTDDTSAIQSAINDAVNHGYTLYIPSGTYIINSSLLIQSSNLVGLEIIGQSQTNTILQYNGNDFAIKIGDGSVALDKVAFQRFGVAGNSNALGGIQINGANRLIFRQLAFSSFNNTDAAGLYFKRSWIHVVEDCRFYGNYYDIYAYDSNSNAGNGLRILHNVFENGNTAIYIRTPRSVSIRDNFIQTYSAEGVHLEVGHGMIIDGNYFEHIPLPIYLGNSAYLSQVNILNNYINLHDATDYGIKANGVNTLSIQNNVFESDPQTAVLYLRGADYTTNINVLNNRLLNVTKPLIASDYTLRNAVIQNPDTSSIDMYNYTITNH